MGKENTLSGQQSPGRDWGRWALDTFLPDRIDPSSEKLSRRELLKLVWRIGKAGAAAAVLSSCGVPPSGSEYSSSQDQSNERFRVMDPGKVAFIAALSGDKLPAPLVDTLMKEGLESAGSFQAVIQSAGGQPETLGLEMVKGKGFPPSKDNASYLVMCDSTQKRWFKVSPTQGMVGRLENGMKAINEEIALLGYELPDGMPRPAMKTITVNGTTLVAMETPYWGPTVNTLLQAGEMGQAKALYQDAYYTALKLMTQKGITVRDPNPGNIARLTLKNGKTVGFVFDFESSGAFVVSPTEKNIASLIARFDKWNKRYNLGLDLRIPADIAPSLLLEKQGMIVGRVFLPKGFVDFEFSFEGLSAAQISKLRDTIAQTIRNNPVDDVGELVLEGKQVTLRRTLLSGADDMLDDALRTGVPARSSTALGVANVVLLMSIGTVEIAPGLEGMTIDMPGTENSLAQTGHYMTYMKPADLRRRGVEYITRLKLLLRGEHAVEGDSWLTGVTITPADRAAMEYVMGMSADELLHVQREFHISTDTIFSYLDEQLDNTQVPFKTALRFASPFPGIPGATMEIPVWTSTYRAHDGTEVVQLWMDNWETTLGFTDAPQSGQMIIPVIRWEKPAGGSWNVTFEDAARLGMGFSIARTDLPPAKCLVYSNPSKGLVMDCSLPKVNP